LLFQSPSEYFLNLFQSGYENRYGGFFASDYSWWNDLKSNMFIKFLSILNVFSFGNYYVNVIFYSFITFIGPIALYWVFSVIFYFSNYFVVILVSALFACILSSRIQKRNAIIYFSTYLIC